MRRSWRILCLLVVLLNFPQVFAAEFCQLEIESYLGKILDARLILDAGKVDSNTQFRHATQSDYQKNNLPYDDLHRRILIESVSSAAPPYIAISSIGVINQASFAVLLKVETEQQVRFEPCHISLAKVPVIEPKVRPKPVLSPSQILSRLLTLLSSGRGLTRAEAMSELQHLQMKTSAHAGEQRFIISLQGDPLEDHLDEEFIIGLRALMTPEEEKLFAQSVSEHGTVATVLDVLFSTPDRLLLSRLLQKGLTEVVANNGAASAEILQQQLAVLENQLARSQSEAFRPDMAIVTPPPKESIVQKMQLQRWILSFKFWLGLSAVCASVFFIVIGRYISCRRSHEPGR